MRHTGTVRIAPTFLVVAMIAAACGAGAGGEPGELATQPPASTQPPPATEAPPGEQQDAARLMALALHQLVTLDTTFGPDHRLGTVAIRTSTNEPDPRPLTDAERSAIEQLVGGVSTVQWVEPATSWLGDDGAPIVENSALIGVGEPRFDDDGALVPVSLLCGNLCGTWFEYRLRFVDGEWQVIGPEGPVAIS